MELTSKQRAQLRALANGLDTILQIGKEGIGDNVIQQANEALEARELIKCRVLESAMLPPPGGLPGTGPAHPQRRGAGHRHQICAIQREPQQGEERQDRVGKGPEETEPKITGKAGGIKS